MLELLALQVEVGGGAASPDRREGTVYCKHFRTVERRFGVDPARLDDGLAERVTICFETFKLHAYLPRLGDAGSWGDKLMRDAACHEFLRDVADWVSELDAARGGEALAESLDCYLRYAAPFGKPVNTDHAVLQRMDHFRYQRHGAIPSYGAGQFRNPSWNPGYLRLMPTESEGSMTNTTTTTTASSSMSALLSFRGLFFSSASSSSSGSAKTSSRPLPLSGNRSPTPPLPRANFYLRESVSYCGGGGGGGEIPRLADGGDEANDARREPRLTGVRAVTLVYHPSPISPTASSASSLRINPRQRITAQVSLLPSSPSPASTVASVLHECVEKIEQSPTGDGMLDSVVSILVPPLAVIRKSLLGDVVSSESGATGAKEEEEDDSRRDECEIARWTFPIYGGLENLTWCPILATYRYCLVRHRPPGGGETSAIRNPITTHNQGKLFVSVNVRLAPRETFEMHQLRVGVRLPFRPLPSSLRDPPLGADDSIASVITAPILRRLETTAGRLEPSDGGDDDIAWCDILPGPETSTNGAGKSPEWSSYVLRGFIPVSLLMSGEDLEGRNKRAARCAIRFAGIPKNRRDASSRLVKLTPDDGTFSHREEVIEMRSRWSVEDGNDFIVYATEMPSVASF